MTLTLLMSKIGTTYINILYVNVLIIFYMLLYLNEYVYCLICGRQILLM